MLGYVIAFVLGMFCTKVIWAIQDSRRDLALPPATKRELRCAAKNKTDLRRVLRGDRMWRPR